MRFKRERRWTKAEAAQMRYVPYFGATYHRAAKRDRFTSPLRTVCGKYVDLRPDVNARSGCWQIVSRTFVHGHRPCRICFPKGDELVDNP